MKKSVLALRLIGVGFFIGISIVLGVVAGRWLDEKAHTGALFTILGLLLGLLNAFYGVYKLVKPLMGDDGKEDQ